MNKLQISQNKNLETIKKLISLIKIESTGGYET